MFTDDSLHVLMLRAFCLGCQGVAPQHCSTLYVGRKAEQRSTQHCHDCGVLVWTCYSWCLTPETWGGHWHLPDITTTVTVLTPCIELNIHEGAATTLHCFSFGMLVSLHSRQLILQRLAAVSRSRSYRCCSVAAALAVVDTTRMLEDSSLCDTVCGYRRLAHGHIVWMSVRVT
jgi:hypothetical protein